MDTQTRLPTDTWVVATWDEYIQAIENPAYEELAVAEYWLVDVQRAQIRAFAVADGGSRRITESEVLPGLAMSLLEEALRRSREVDQTQVGAWLLQQFQA